MPVMNSKTNRSLVAAVGSLCSYHDRRKHFVGFTEPELQFDLPSDTGATGIH